MTAHEPSSSDAAASGVWGGGSGAMPLPVGAPGVLYFDPNKLLYIEGLPEAESDALIEELKEYRVQPGAQYRHKWGKGDIVIWDNRCSYHLAAGDYPPEEDRIHWRVSICEPGAAA